MLEEEESGVLSKIFDIQCWPQVPEPRLITARFGVEQGSVKFGTFKVRPIDDYRASKLNCTTQIQNAVVLQDTRHFKQMYHLVQGIPNLDRTPLVTWKADQTG